MKNIKELPFSIGEEYEKWELNLEPLEKERIKGYDSYLYLKDVEFLGLKSTRTELIFSLDILQIVILHFNEMTIIYGKLKSCI